MRKIHMDGDRLCHLSLYYFSKQPEMFVTIKKLELLFIIRINTEILKIIINIKYIKQLE